MAKPIRPVVIDGDIVRVPLTQGLEAVVDLVDLALVDGRNWQANPNMNTFYASTNESMLTGRARAYMHRVIMDCGPGGPDVDHMDGNGLNNRRSNLRVATRSQNLGNSRSREGTSRFKGVSWDAPRGRWKAQIVVGGKNRFLGRFSSEADAARAYDLAAMDAFESFARLNYPAGGVSAWD